MGPRLLDSHLEVRPVVTNLAQLAEDDFFVIEKASGRVHRIVDGALHSTVLDLPVNSASERGHLGIALHPDFPANPGVYLYRTEEEIKHGSERK